MKPIKFVVLMLILVSVSKLHCQGQTDYKVIPLYVSMDAGKSFLLNPQGLDNKSAPFRVSSSQNVAFYWNIPLSKSPTIPLSGFNIAPGIGIGTSTFGINKDIVKVSDKLNIVDIAGAYTYNIVQGNYVDLVVDARYLTKPNKENVNFCFEIGTKVGKLYSSVKEMMRETGDTENIQRMKNPGIMNDLRYGLNARTSFRMLNARKQSIGLTLSLLGSCYLSDTFDKSLNIDAKSCYLGIGFGFIFM